MTVATFTATGNGSDVNGKKVVMSLTIQQAFDKQHDRVEDGMVVVATALRSAAREANLSNLSITSISGITNSIVMGGIPTREQLTD